jgi:CP family cyanate transporter-like MFS transporter
MSSAAAGVLTSIPYACFGLVAAGAPLLVRRLGAEATLVLGLLAMGGGAVVRAGPAAALFAGTAASAVGVALGNVVVPAIVKERFSRIGALMGGYTTALSAGAALAGGLAVPAARTLGLPAALAIWALPAFIASGALVAARRRARRSSSRETAGARAVLRDPVAWRVTLFFGLQAAVVFAGLSWLPSILRADGYSAESAGVLLSVFALGAMPASLVTPPLAMRLADQRAPAALAAGVEALAVAGLAPCPQAAPAWVVLFALAQGAAFSLAVTLILLRSPDARSATALSGMAQSVGYCIAAAGPLAVGLLHGATHEWRAPLALMAALCAPMAVSGMGAGRGGATVRGSSHTRANAAGEGM